MQFQAQAAQQKVVRLVPAERHHYRPIALIGPALLLSLGVVIGLINLLAWIQLVGALLGN
jgi:hypothetical protein